MFTWIEKVIWSALCGTAVGMSGCGGKDTKGEPDAEDTETDTADTAGDQPVDTAADVPEDTAADTPADTAADTIEDTSDDSVADTAEDPTDDLDVVDDEVVADAGDVASDPDEEEIAFLYGPPIA
jgi:hypothetical protein